MEKHVGNGVIFGAEKGRGIGSVPHERIMPRDFCDHMDTASIEFGRPVHDGDGQDVQNAVTLQHAAGAIPRARTGRWTEEWRLGHSSRRPWSSSSASAPCVGLGRPRSPPGKFTNNRISAHPKNPKNVCCFRTVRELATNTWYFAHSGLAMRCVLVSAASHQVGLCGLNRTVVFSYHVC